MVSDALGVGALAGLSPALPRGVTPVGGWFPVTIGRVEAPPSALDLSSPLVRCEGVEGARSRPRQGSTYTAGDLGAAGRLNLGRTPFCEGDLVVAAPPDRRLVTDSDTMLADLLPEFWNVRELTWGAAHANLRSFDEVARVPGLFWSGGWGRYHRALLWALVLLHQQAGLVSDPTCSAGYSVANLRADLERGAVPVGTDLGMLGWDPARLPTFSFDVDGEGRYTSTIGVSRGSVVRRRGMTYGGQIHVYDPSFTFAGNADFYLHWAHRLYDRWIVEGDRLSGLGARLCARAALAEVAGLATLLVHEYFHLFRAEAYECRSSRGGLDCVCFVASYSFLHRVLCRFRLPVPMNVRFGDGTWPRVYDRFDYGMDRETGPSGTHYMVGGCQPEGTDDPFSYSHANFWTGRRSVTLTVRLSSRCSSDDTSRELVNAYTG